MPDIIQFKNGNQVINTYSANGQKLRTKYYTAIYPVLSPVIVPVNTIHAPYSTSDATLRLDDYLGSILYENGTAEDAAHHPLTKVMTPEGYVDYATVGKPYCYYRQDHLGSIREVDSYQGNNRTVVQKTQYYPSGTPFQESFGAGAQPYKFTGKEMITMHGLNWQDFGARWLDNARLQWTSMDPLAEKYYSISPYAYCAGNPVNAVDPDGREPEEGEPSGGENDKFQISNLQKASYGNNVITNTLTFTNNASASLINQGISIVNSAANLLQSNPSEIAAGVKSDVNNVISGAKQLANTPLDQNLVGIKNTLTNVNFWEDAVGNILAIIAVKNLGGSGSTTTASTATEAADEATPIGVRNGHLAGQVHPASGVPFDNAGFPDFSNYLYKGGANDVIIEPTGNRATDFMSANKSSGYGSTPKGYTWHHHQTTGRMQLVETNVHSQTGHTGGFSLW